MKKYFGSNKPRVILKKGKAKPFWYHHPWIFSGAIQEIKGNPEDGDIVEVLDEENRFIAKGLINHKSQIKVRLLTWDQHEKIDGNFFRSKIHQAISLRENILIMRSKSSAYRLVHSEGDGLPGLTIDRYNDFLVVQFLSTGMEKRKEMILDILKEQIKPQGIVERYPAGYREKEGLVEIDCMVHGKTPPKMTITEYGVKFYVDLQKGQKTGFYLDQRENRLLLTRYGYNKRILDAFCYSGGFGVYMLSKARPGEVVFMDSSSFALELAQENASMNSTATAVFSKKDIFKEIPEMEKAGEKYDMIVLDPPKVSPDRASLVTGTEALINLNKHAVNMLPPGGILATCDCSGNISWEDFFKIVNKAVLDANRSLKIFETLGAGPDHPVNPACLENSYLKVIVAAIY